MDHNKRPSKTGLVIGSLLLAVGVAGSSWSLATQGDGKPVEKPRTAVETPAAAESPVSDLSVWFVTVADDYDKFADDLDGLAENTGLPTEGQCQTLLKDVQNLRKNPIPEDPFLVHNSWNRAMNAYEMAFEACIDGDYLFMASSLERGTEELNTATEAIPE